MLKLARSIAAKIIGTQTEEERTWVEGWIGQEKSRKVFLDKLSDKEEYIKNENELKKFPPEEAWDNIRKEISLSNASSIKKILPYAAAFLLLVSSVSFLYLMHRNKKDKEQTVILTEIPAGVKGAVLILEDGQSVDVSEGNIFEITATDGTKILKDSIGLGYKIEPKSSSGKNVPDEKVVYNTIQTSKGMEYPLRLADGTKIYINSESRLRFPVSFRARERVVELEGEAFFEVAKDPSHPFIVKSGNLEVRVLGTQFNLKSYSDDKLIVTTLVEGSLMVNSHKLSPGEQLNYSKNTGKIEVKKVSTDIYTAWRNGKFVFRNERLEDIMKNLARWYNFEYRFLDEQAKDLCFGASFDRYDTMNPILEMLFRTELVDIHQAGSIINISTKK